MWEVKGNYKLSKRLFKIAGMMPIPKIIPIDFNLDPNSISVTANEKKVSNKYLTFVEAFYH